MIEEIEQARDRAAGRLIERPGGDRAGGRRSSGLDMIEEIERPGGDRAAGRRSSGLDTIEEIERPGGDRAGGRRSSVLNTIEEIERPGGDRAAGRRSSGLNTIEEIERPGGDRAAGRRSSGLDTMEEIERPGGDRAAGRRSSGLDMIEEIERPGGDRAGRRRSSGLNMMEEIKRPGGDRAGGRRSSGLDMMEEFERPGGDRAGGRRSSGLDMMEEIERPGGDRAGGRRSSGLDMIDEIERLGGQGEGRSERGRRFQKMKMEAVVATEEWIRNKAQLINVRADEVESLSLQGTYNDKIVALGDALLNFKRLRSLDLSRNSIVNLGGLECLHSLEKLNLYYNNVPALKEISSLRHLINLKELDLRLNPITRNEQNYRQCIIRLLPNLKRLDDRPIRDSERKTAQMYFNSQEQNGTSELDKTEESDHIKKNFMHDKDEQDSMSPTMKYKWDAASNIKTDLKERWASRDFQLMNDRQESACSRPPLSAHYSARDVRETRENDVSSKMSLDPMETEHLRSRQYHSYLGEDLKTSSTYGSSKNTHVDDSTSNHRSRMPSIGLIPHHGTSSSDHIVDRQSLISPSSSFTSLYSVGSKRGFTEHVNTELMANKSSERQSQLTTANMEHFESKLEPKKTSSLSSELYMQPSYDRKQSTLDKLLEADECGDYHSRTPVGLSSGVSANVTSTLQNFLDLVDRHWNGSRSLHTNQRFLNSAHELLSNMMNSMSISKIQSLEKKVKAGSGLDTAELHRLKHQLTQKQDDLESLKGRFAKVLDENNKLRSQLTSLELANCAGNQLQNKNLQKEYDRLNLEVEYLRQQVKQYNKLQDTVSLLQESHRALISTNNYLQEQLNIRPAGQKSDMSHHLGPHRTKVWSKLSASGMSELSLSSKSSHHSNIDIL